MVKYKAVRVEEYKDEWDVKLWRSDTDPDGYNEYFWFGVWKKDHIDKETGEVLETEYYGDWLKYVPSTRWSVDRMRSKIQSDPEEFEKAYDTAMKAIGINC